MSDSGRALYKMQDAENRLTHGTVGGTELACELLKAGKIAIVGSAFSSVEEQFLLKKFADKVSAVWCGVLAHSGKSDGFLISADHAPNTRGAILTGLSNGLPTTRLDELKAKIAAGRCPPS
jgi:NADH-quinone oxidoreductase subunit G